MILDQYLSSSRKLFKIGPMYGTRANRVASDDLKCHLKAHEPKFWSGDGSVYTHMLIPFGIATKFGTVAHLRVTHV